MWFFGIGKPKSSDSVSKTVDISMLISKFGVLQQIAPPTRSECGRYVAVEFDQRFRQQAIESIREIAELIVFGEKQGKREFFDFFAEKGLFAYFVACLGLEGVPREVVVQLLQTISILLYNVREKTNLYFILSNNHVNFLLSTPFALFDSEISAYYATLVKSLALKLDSETARFFLNGNSNWFPLFSESVRLFCHPDSMIRTGMQTATLKLLGGGDSFVHMHLIQRPRLFDYMACMLRRQWLMLDNQTNPSQELLDSIDDYVCFIEDVFNLGSPSVSRLLLDRLLRFVFLPLILGTVLKKPLKVTKTKTYYSSGAAAGFLEPNSNFLSNDHANNYANNPKSQLQSDFVSNGSPCSRISEESMPCLNSLNLLTSSMSIKATPSHQIGVSASEKKLDKSDASATGNSSVKSFKELLSVPSPNYEFSPSSAKVSSTSCAAPSKLKYANIPALELQDFETATTLSSVRLAVFLVTRYVRVSTTKVISQCLLDCLLAKNVPKNWIELAMNPCSIPSIFHHLTRDTTWLCGKSHLIVPFEDDPLCGPISSPPPPLEPVLYNKFVSINDPDAEIIQRSARKTALTSRHVNAINATAADGFKSEIMAPSDAGCDLSCEFIKNPARERLLTWIAGANASPPPSPYATMIQKFNQSRGTGPHAPLDPCLIVRIWWRLTALNDHSKFAPLYEEEFGEEHQTRASVPSFARATAQFARTELKAVTSRGKEADPLLLGFAGLLISILWRADTLLNPDALIEYGLSPSHAASNMQHKNSFDKSKEEHQRKSRGGLELLIPPAQDTPKGKKQKKHGKPRKKSFTSCVVTSGEEKNEITSNELQDQHLKNEFQNPLAGVTMPMASPDSANRVPVSSFSSGDVAVDTPISPDCWESADLLFLTLCLLQNLMRMRPVTTRAICTLLVEVLETRLVLPYANVLEFARQSALLGLAETARALISPTRAIGSDSVLISFSAAWCSCNSLSGLSNLTPGTLERLSKQPVPDVLASANFANIVANSCMIPHGDSKLSSANDSKSFFVDELGSFSTVPAGAKLLRMEDSVDLKPITASDSAIGPASNFPIDINFWVMHSSNAPSLVRPAGSWFAAGFNASFALLLLHKLTGSIRATSVEMSQHGRRTADMLRMIWVRMCIPANPANPASEDPSSSESLSEEEMISRGYRELATWEYPPASEPGGPRIHREFVSGANIQIGSSHRVSCSVLPGAVVATGSSAAISNVLQNGLVMASTANEPDSSTGSTLNNNHFSSLLSIRPAQFGSHPSQHPSALRRYLVLHPSHFILVAPDTVTPGNAIVKLAIPLRDIEIVLSRADPRLMTVFLRSSNQPIDASSFVVTLDNISTNATGNCNGSSNNNKKTLVAKSISAPAARNPSLLTNSKTSPPPPPPRAAGAPQNMSLWQITLAFDDMKRAVLVRTLLENSKRSLKDWQCGHLEKFLRKLGGGLPTARAYDMVVAMKDGILANN